MKLVVNLESKEAMGESSDQPPIKKLRTLMDVALTENYWPPYKNNDQVTCLSKYIEDFKQDSTSAIENLVSYIMHSKVQSKIVLYDTLLILFKQNCRDVFNENVNDFGTLCMAVRDLIWYTSPHADKFKSRSATLPNFLSVVQPFNDPRRHHHAIPKLNRETLLRYADNVTNLLEKSFVHRNSFSVVLDMIEKLVESCAKYSDYLEDNLTHVSDYQSQEEPEEITNLVELPECSSESVQELYTSKRDRDLVEIIRL